MLRTNLKQKKNPLLIAIITAVSFFIGLSLVKYFRQGQFDITDLAQSLLSALVFFIVYFLLQNYLNKRIERKKQKEKREIMNRNKKIIYFSVGILLIVAFAIYFIFFTCSDHYTVTCYHPDSENKETKNISCSSNNDCSVKSMVSYCSPDCPDLFYRAYGKYYCGDDGYCKGCNAYTSWRNNDYAAEKNWKRLDFRF